MTDNEVQSVKWHIFALRSRLPDDPALPRLVLRTVRLWMQWASEVPPRGDEYEFARAALEAIDVLPDSFFEE